MTATQPRSLSDETAAEPLPNVDAAAAVAEAVIRLTRSVNRMRAQAMAEARHSVEWSASMLINQLASEGPMRSSALAEQVQSDPSTVSRQVAALVKDGLVERRADPEDGRVSMLAVTAKGQRAHEANKRLRNEHYQRMLAGWDKVELHAFAAQVTRFADGFEQCKTKWLREAADRSSADEEESR